MFLEFYPLLLTFSSAVFVMMLKWENSFVSWLNMSNQIFIPVFFIMYLYHVKPQFKSRLLR
jgi:hypothetical protein